MENMDECNVSNEMQSRLTVGREQLEELRKIKMEGIVVRSRARWYEQGEKSTAYFLGLEKRNYLNKLIASLHDSNHERKTKQTDIMEILVRHFAHLFSERPIDCGKAEEFVDGLSITRLSEVQNKEMNRPFTLQDFTDTLKGMSNSKAPGTDGFPAEFYKVFWKDLKHFFYKMALESYHNGMLPNSLKEGILALIPKPMKPRDEVNSYRPITLLNTSYKIISSAIANRIKKVLPDVIGKEQSGFIKNRFIGDNTRLTYDLIQFLKKTNRRALFLSLDIQDAFNSVNWDFIRLLLRKQNFPEFFIHWFDTLCFEASSFIVYNGHISERIRLERSCRQGDPLSPYIFLVVMDALLEKIKQNKLIGGVKVGNFEFKLSAYADDTLCYLDGSVNSCRALFDDLGVFAKYSGLSPNIRKTQAIWVGKEAEEQEPICLELDMNWTKKLKVLGITFSNEDAHSFEENYESRMTKIKAVISSWSRRSLSLKGKVIIIKTLLLPILTHVLTALPRPSNEFMNRLRAVFFHFIWNGKVDRLKRSSLYKKEREGGMAMVDIEIYNVALKASWIRREITGNHDWCKVFMHEISQGRFIWERNSSSLRKTAGKTYNKFWSEVMVAMSQYDNSVKTEIEDIGKHCIWYSNHTKFKNMELRSWKQRGMVYINDLLKENGEIMSFEEAKNWYDFNGTKLDYLGLVQSLPIEWRNRQRKIKESNPIIHPNILNIMSHKQVSKYIYNVLLYNKYKNVRNNWEFGWELELGQIDWVEVYKHNMKLTSIAYQALQYKILTKIVATNRLLYQIGITETPRCERCRESVDTIVHKFWACPAVKQFWTEVKLYLQNMGVIQNISVFNLKMIILGNTESSIVNHATVIGKSMIARKYTLSVELFLILLKRDMEKERYIAAQKSEMRDYDSKWGTLAAALR